MSIKNTIQPVELHQLLISDSAPILIDVRRQAAFQQSCDVIVSARWRDHQCVSTWAQLLPKDREIVIYCAHAEQVSLATNAILQSLGFNSRLLAGGISEWKNQNLPLLNRDAWQTYYAKNWTSLASVSLDGLACAWFIQRLINPSASIYYIQDDWASEAAIESNSILFNVNKTDTFPCHNNARCAFDSFIEEFSIKSDALQYIASIVRSITANRLDLNAQAAGIAAILRGLTLKNTDPQQLQKRSAQIFDALYISAQTP